MPSSFGTTSFKPVASKILRAIKDEPSEHFTENWLPTGPTSVTRPGRRVTVSYC